MLSQEELLIVFWWQTNLDRDKSTVLVTKKLNTIDW